MIKLLLLIMICAFAPLLLQAQNVGIGTNAPTHKLDIRGKHTDDGPLILLGNSDQSHRLLIFPGRQNDPNPFILWRSTDPLRFATDLAGFTEWMRINPNGNVGIGTTTPDPSALLDLTSSSKGILPPRMSKEDRNAIEVPVAGLVIWCSNCGTSGQMQVFNGRQWTNMAGGVPDEIKIGDTYSGGIVGYLLQPGDPGYIPGEKHGFIVAAQDQSTGTTWGCEGQWTGIRVNVTSAALGTGEINTRNIINSCNQPGIAARICGDLVLNGYDDWFLPSLEELNKLYLNRTAIGGFADTSYWSSTESSSTHAFYISFYDGLSYTTTKSLFFYVRAVRAF